MFVEETRICLLETQCYLEKHIFLEKHMYFEANIISLRGNNVVIPMGFRTIAICTCMLGHCIGTSYNLDLAFANKE